MLKRSLLCLFCGLLYGLSYGLDFKKLEDIILKWQKLKDHNCVLVKIEPNLVFERFLSKNYKMQMISIQSGEINMNDFIDASSRNFVFGTGCNIFLASKEEILVNHSFFKTLGKAVTNQFWIINDDVRNITSKNVKY